MMQHYRKKPVIIRAKQYDGTKQSAVAIIGTLRELAESDSKIRSHFQDKFYRPTAVYDDETFEFTVTTTEGVMKVSKNDYVLVGTQGEIYPCKPQMFTDSYEMVDWEKDRLSDLWPEETNDKKEQRQ